MSATFSFHNPNIMALTGSRSHHPSSSYFMQAIKPKVEAEGFL
jgi:hypothetical protein